MSLWCHYSVLHSLRPVRDLQAHTGEIPLDGRNRAPADASISPASFCCAAVGVACLLIACGYELTVAVAILTWRLNGCYSVVEPVRPPPITLLKPLCGAETELYDNLRSFFRQKYDRFQIVFGVRDASDPGYIPSARTL
jgi:hypothetical protein